MKRKTLIQMYEEISQQPKSVVDRRKKRPIKGGTYGEPGGPTLHRDEVLMMMEAVAPRGVKAQVELAYNNRYFEVAHKRDHSITIPGYRDLAIRHEFFDWVYLYTDHKGWVNDITALKSGLTVFDRAIERFNATLLRTWRDQRGLTTEEKPSLKGKPRREVKTASFEEYFARIRAPHNTDFVINSMPDVPTLMDATRTWGIEIEVAGARGVECPAGWDWTEDGSLESAYASSDPSDCECDCMYCTDYNDHDCGYEDCGGWGEDDCKEFVSPILDSVYESGVTSICDAVRFEPQNASAGIHVHVGADGLTPKQIGGLVYGYGILEKMLEASYQREDRNYCHELKPRDVQRVISASREKKNTRDMDVIDRYVTVNVCALPKHGTVEFRALGPVYDSEYIHKWAMFCREMVNVAASDAPVNVWHKVQTFEDVKAIFRKYGKELNTVESRANAQVPVAV